MLVTYELHGKLILEDTNSPDPFGLNNASFVYSVLLDTAKTPESVEADSAWWRGNPARLTFAGTNGLDGAHEGSDISWYTGMWRSVNKIDHRGNVGGMEGEFLIIWTIFMQNDRLFGDPLTFPTSITCADVDRIEGSCGWSKPGIQPGSPALQYTCRLLFSNTCLTVTPVRKHRCWRWSALDYLGRLFRRSSFKILAGYLKSLSL